MKRTGAGIVVFRRSLSGPTVLILRKAERQDWDLPKGHVELGEPAEEAALRETYEETGLHPTLLHGYTRVVEIPKAAKPHRPAYTMVTTFLVGEAGIEDDVVLSTEHDAYAWLPAERAASRLASKELAPVVFDALRHAVGKISPD